MDYNNLENGIAGIRETIKDFDKKPILDLTINNVDSDTGIVYDIIKQELEDLSLMIRPTFNMIGEESIDEIITQNESLGPKELLIEQLKGYGSDDVNTLAVELYDFLSKDKIDEAKDLVSLFYDTHYRNVEDIVEFKTEEVEKEEPPEEESDDVQVTFNEVLK